MEIGIADLKARLSEVLRHVRRGHEAVVLDRNQRIARLVPYEADRGLVVRGPAPGAVAPGEVQLPRARRIRSDVVEVLLRERQSDR